MQMFVCMYVCACVCLSARAGVCCGWATTQNEREWQSEGPVSTSGMTGTGRGVAPGGGGGERGGGGEGGGGAGGGGGG